MRNQCNYIWKIWGWSWESCQTCVQIASFDSPHLVSYKNHQLPPTKHTYTREMINMKYMTHLCLFKVSKMFEFLSNLQDCDMTQSTHCVKRPQIKINVAWLSQKALKFWSSSVQRTSALWCVCRSPPPPPLSFSLTLTASCSLLWTVFLKKAVGNESARSKPAAECLLSQSICPPRGGDRGASLTLSPLFFSLLKSLLTVAARFKRLSLSVLPWGGN